MSNTKTSTNQYSINPWLIVGAIVALGFCLLLCVITIAATVAFVFLTSRTEISPVMEEPTMIFPEPKNIVNRIVYVDDQGQLRTVAPDGSDSKQLTSSRRQYQFPSWAADGSSVAAIGSDGVRAGVYVFSDEEGAQPTTLYESEDRTPIYHYWSPDSRWVSFLANDRGSLGLWLAPAAGTSPADLLSLGQPFYWQWGSESDEVLIHTGGSDPDAQLGFLEVEGPSQVQNLAQSGFFQAPGISPSGAFISFSELSDAGQSRIVIQSQLDDTRLELDHRGASAMTWSPVADILAFTNPEIDAPHYYGPLRIIDAETGDSRALSTRMSVAFFWSPNGRSIIYLSPAGSDDKPNASVPSTQMLISTQTQTDRLQLDLFVVDVESGEERFLTRFQPNPLFVAQFLPFFDQYALSHKLWSPASDAFVLPIVDENGFERVTVIAVDDGSSTIIGNGSTGFWARQ